MMDAIFDIPEQHAAVPIFLFQKIPPAEHLWALTGSTGLRLQGVDTSVHDLDLQTNMKTVFLMEERLAEFMKVPVHLWETEHTLSYHGQAEIFGLQVELFGDICHRLPDGSWSAPPDIDSILVWLKWRDLNIPVLSLEHEVFAYEKMGRVQKAELIRAASRKES